jgi:hypothetical protein
MGRIRKRVCQAVTYNLAEMLIAQRMRDILSRDDRRNSRWCVPRLYPGETRPVTNWSPTSHSFLPGQTRSEKRKGVKLARRAYLESVWKTQ